MTACKTIFTLVKNANKVISYLLSGNVRPAKFRIASLVLHKSNAENANLNTTLTMIDLAKNVKFKIVPLASSPEIKQIPTPSATNAIGDTNGMNLTSTAPSDLKTMKNLGTSWHSLPSQEQVIIPLRSISHCGVMHHLQVVPVTTPGEQSSPDGLQLSQPFQ